MDELTNRTSKTAEPVWEIATLFPEQGAWSEEDYLGLDANRLIEFSHGHLEFLNMPTLSHQRIVSYLYRILLLFITSQTISGEVLFAPLRVRLWPGKYREPDIILMLGEDDKRRKEQYLEGADLVMEVISPDDPERDMVKKRDEYARAGIPEYWLINPLRRTITVLQLQDKTYLVHGEFVVGEQASSVLLPGFGVDVSQVFAAAGQ